MDKKPQSPDVATRDEQSRPITDQERNSLRAFLQRSEVRLSTIQRTMMMVVVLTSLVAVAAFVYSGQLGESSLSIATHVEDIYSSTDLSQVSIKILVTISLLIPTLIALFVISTFIYSITRDVVKFYFAVDTLGLHHSVVSPSLAMPGLSYPSDESATVKLEMLRKEMMPQYVSYVLTLNDQSRKWHFDPLIEATKGEIIDRTRSIQSLEELGIHLDIKEQTNANYLRSHMKIMRECA
ncbi:MAG: hypothetical protein IPO91_19230 [Chloroflexi bacterium]|jgi:hypothetical protein|nr:hypothetical protein [Chloroflexota bacterium]